MLATPLNKSEDHSSACVDDLAKVQAPSPSKTYILPNKCKLAYDEYGSKSGYPVFYFHDNGSSRLECFFYHRSARKQGFRLIAVDRPGIGCSDYYPLQSCAQFCEDLLLLADELDLTEFGIMSLGAGGVFALSMAHQFPARVKFQLCLAGVPGHVFNERVSNSTISNCIGSVAPALIRILVGLKQNFFPENPDKALQRLENNLSYTDRKVLANPRIRKILAMDQNEVLRNGCRGLAQDTAHCFRKLEFSLKQISVPMEIWQGSADRMSQRSDCEYLASNLPQANYNRVANRGHFFFIQNMDEVFSKLRPSQNVRLERAA